MAAVDEHLAAAYDILDELDEAGERVRERADDIDDPAHRLRYVVAALRTIRDEAASTARYRSPPVDVRTFVEGANYLNKPGVLWPLVMRELEEMTSGRYIEAVLTGGIGTAKTTLALYAQAYELYKIMLLRNPHAEFDLDPASEIVIVFQSVTGATARGVDYERFRAMVESSPWFARNAPPDPEIKSEIRMPRRVKVQPVSSNETGAIGENVIGGIIDEINFMAVIEKSARAVDGGVYDQAVTNYNSIARRRESRFMNQGSVAGLLCLVSSSRYPGQFTDRKKEEAAMPGARIFVYDKRRWEIKPDSFGGERFRVYAGTLTQKPRILGEAEKLRDDEEGPVVEVPVEYRHQFEVDIYNALRDIAGTSTQAANPFIPAPDKVAASFGHLPSVFKTQETDFVTEKLALRLKHVEDRKALRWAHVDLGATGDAAGLAVGHVSRFVRVDRDDGQYEVLPEVVIDGLLRIVPPPGGEIMFDKVRSVLYLLRDNGLPLKWVSFDSWQSRDSMQILRNKGFVVGEISMDRDTRAYDVTKRAIYDGRLLCPDHETCLRELVTLTYDPKTSKVDHTPTGSKDVADALAGVVSGLSSRREIYAVHGVRPGDVVDPSRDVRGSKDTA